jgi:hypothetical protein
VDAPCSIQRLTGRGGPLRRSVIRRSDADGRACSERGRCATDNAAVPPFNLGWAADEDAPTAPLTVRFSIDGARAGDTTALVVYDGPVTVRPTEDGGGSAVNHVRSAAPSRRVMC